MTTIKTNLILPSLLILLLTATPAVSQVSIKQLQQTIDQLRQEHKVAGTWLTIVSDQEVLLLDALGMADIKTQRPANTKDIIRIGSITKAITGLALLKLEQQEKIQLNKALKHYLKKPPYTNQWHNTHPITTAQLLEHTAGFTDLNQQEFDNTRHLPLATALSLKPNSRISRWPPGLHASYSNAGAGVAAYVLEQRSGQNFEDYVQQEIFNPLNMQHSNFVLNKQVSDKLASGYDSDGISPIPYWHTLFRAFGGMNSRLDDMATFVQFLLNHGRLENQSILTADAIRRMEISKTTLAARTGLTYGYGFGNYSYYHKQTLFHGHGGDADGYLAHYAYNRATGLGYFIVINAFKHSALRAMRNSLENWIVSHRPQTNTATQARFTLNNSAQFIGRYQAITYRFGQKPNDWLDITQENQRLYTKTSAGIKRELIPVNQQHFRRPWQTAATIAIVKHNNTFYLQGDIGNYQKTAPRPPKPKIKKQ